MSLLDACICIQNTHRYPYKTRIYSIWVFCMHMHVSKRHIYRYAFKVFSEKQYIGLEPIYHEPILKQMANHSVEMHLYVGIV